MWTLEKKAHKTEEIWHVSLFKRFFLSSCSSPLSCIKHTGRKLYLQTLQINQSLKIFIMKYILGGIQFLLLKDSLLSLPVGLLILKNSSLLLQLFVLCLQVPLHLFVASLQLKFRTLKTLSQKQRQKAFVTAKYKYKKNYWTFTFSKLFI